MGDKLQEFPVLLENEVISLFLNKADIEKALKDQKFLLSLIEKEQSSKENDNPEDENVDKNDTEKKMFVWPDKAVLLLLDMYREREEDFSNGLKRSNKIWAEIAAQMKNFNPEYEVTSNQCATKMSGLKRTYKNIVDQNKKSGNHRSSWAFFSVMDSIFGNKASTRAPAIATSDGPSDPNIEGSSSSLSSITETPELKSPPRKRKRIEHVVEEFIERIKVEKEETREEMKRRETNQEKVREEKRKDREKRHNEQMEVQRSLISILQQFLNK